MLILTKMIKLSVSPGNTKMGTIPSISLPPVETCAKNAPCVGLCYARRMCRRYKDTAEAYRRNLELWNVEPSAFELQATASAMLTRFFRWHVGGDIPSMEYLNMMCNVAARCTHTEFLVFTKKYEVVNTFIDEGGNVPQNLKIIFSEWGEFKPYNPHDLPTAAVIFKNEVPPSDTKICGGNCTVCACQGVGCWELKKGEKIYFYQH